MEATKKKLKNNSSNQFKTPLLGILSSLSKITSFECKLLYIKFWHMVHRNIQQTKVPWQQLIIICPFENIGEVLEEICRWSLYINTILFFIVKSLIFTSKKEDHL